MASDAMPTTQLADMLTAWTGGLTTPVIILATNSFSPSPNTVYTDLVQPASSDWYASPPAAVYNDVYENPDGSVSSAVTPVQMNGDGINICTITGWGVADVGGTILYQSGLFDSPIPMNNALDAVTPSPIITLPAITLS